MSSRTNPAYAELAYRKAIVGEVIQLLRTGYTSAYGDEPEKEIISEDTFREDSAVPEMVVVDFIQGLERQEADLELELNRFEFVKREEEHVAVTKPKAKTSRKKRSQPRRQASKAKGRSPSKSS
jgi:hypothetical protein